jgi:hypothetical protein
VQERRSEIGLGKTLIKSPTVKNFLDALAAVLAGDREAQAFPGRLGPAGGFRDLYGDLCSGEIRPPG